MHVNRKGKGGAKFTCSEREKVKDEVEKLDRRGCTQFQIAERLNVSQQMVGEYLKDIRLKYHERIVLSHAAQVEMQIARLNEIAQEAWDAYERSKENSYREVKETGLVYPKMMEEVERGKKGKNGEGNSPNPRKKSKTGKAVMRLLKVVKTTEGRLPASDYLRIVIECHKEIASLRGIYPAETSNVNVNQVNWDLLASQVSPTGQIENKVEQMIQGILGLGNPIVDNQNPHTNGEVNDEDEKE